MSYYGIMMVVHCDTWITWLVDLSPWYSIYIRTHWTFVLWILDTDWIWL